MEIWERQVGSAADMDMNYYAGVVTYNPNIERLKKNLNAIYSQVKKIVIVDNGSQNVSVVVETLSIYNNITLIKNYKNEGIAKALNQIMGVAASEQIEWVLLLDQDSVVPDGIIEKYSRLINLEQCAVICPQIHDNNLNNQEKKKNQFENVGICITSGSFNNVSIWSQLGCFDEDLFIDSVDNEYCIRLYFNKYKVIRDNSVVLNHELGKTEKHLLKSATNHNATRRYYIARNSLYVAKKYRTISNEFNINYAQANDFLDKLIDPKRIILRQLQFAILVLLYEKDKLHKIVSIFKGMHDGITMYKAYMRNRA